jgi:aspartyl-tRNA(Asn)/glutamyl-tRNA(Gln) amidotransferase subunit B
MAWEVVIGIETHAQLTTASKIFSGASTAFGAEPNSQASAVDLALPGTLPVLNRGAVERAIRFGIAIDAEVAEHSIFARKNYFYPDLPKGYQISQYETPLVRGGTITFVVRPNGREPYEKIVNLTRAHLEEDAGKSIHGYVEGGYVASGYFEEPPPDKSGIDLNRAGVPLLEIVSEPEMHSAAEAVAYAKAIHTLVTWLDVCDGNMQEGSFRCDANVSVRPAGESKLGTRCEIKNLNSFRFLERAIEFEAQRQIELIEDGGTVVQETRLYDAERDETRPLRGKEDAMDYRYFPDPDLLPLVIAKDWIDRVRNDMSELPWEVSKGYQLEYALPKSVASQLTSTREMSLFFENASISNSDTDMPLPLLTDVPFIKTVANWVVGEVSRKLNEDAGQPWQFWIDPQTLGMIALREHEGVISARTAKELISQFWDEDRVRGGCRPSSAVDEIIQSRNLRQISDITAIEKIVDEVLAANTRSVEEFRAGKDKAFNALVGQAMKATHGKANPQQVNDILRRKLES